MFYGVELVFVSILMQCGSISRTLSSMELNLCLCRFECNVVQYLKLDLLIFSWLNAYALKKQMRDFFKLKS